MAAMEARPDVRMTASSWVKDSGKMYKNTKHNTCGY
jgi:hypothetical protein